MNLTRRVLFTTVAPGALAVLAGCATGPNGAPTIDPTLASLLPTSFIDAVTRLVAAGCNSSIRGYIPTAGSIASSVANLFGQAAIGAGIMFVANAITGVANDLCKAVPTTPAAQARLSARLRASSPSNPVAIGVSPSGVRVIGYQVM